MVCLPRLYYVTMYSLWWQEWGVSPSISIPGRGCSGGLCFQKTVVQQEMTLYKEYYFCNKRLWWQKRSLTLWFSSVIYLSKNSSLRITFLLDPKFFSQSYDLHHLTYLLGIRMANEGVPKVYLISWNKIEIFNLSRETIFSIFQI